MWVVEGPFDGASGDLTIQKCKLLKTSARYVVSRKDGPLLINSKKISHEHCEFTVGSFSIDDAADTSVRPRLDFLNKRSKMMKLFRDGKELAVNASAQSELEDGDLITIVTDVTLRIKWEPLNCYISPKCPQMPSLEACASLGIHLSQKHRPDTTHHLVSSFALTVPIISSLVSIARFAQPDWLNEVLHLGMLPLPPEPNAVDIPLEQTFALPLLTKHRPTFSAHLPPRFKDFKVWEPNEERSNMLAGLRFVFVGESGREADSATKAMISQGGGEYEVLSVSSSMSKWHNTITKGLGRVRDGGRALVVVGDEAAIKAAIGDDGWAEVHQILQSSQLKLCAMQAVLEAVADVDISPLTAPPMNDNAPQSPMSSPLPSMVPNTLPDEPSIPPESLSTPQVDQIMEEAREPSPEPPPPPRKKLVRRAPSRQQSQEPPAPPPAAPIVQTDPDAPRVRKTLVRRAKPAAQSMLVGFDDPSLVLSAAPDVSSSMPTKPPDPPSQKPPSSTRSTRLKRRAGTNYNPLDILGPPVEVEQPPLKKFKALFDASAPDQTLSMEDYYSQTQTQSGPASSMPRPRPVLNDIREEEESQASRPPPEVVKVPEVRGAKRKATPEDNRPSTSTQDKPPSAKRKQPEKRATSPSHPDQDLAFLKAVATIPRESVATDELDKDFKTLRVAQPELEDQAREWAVLEEFGDDSNLRGNFMVVVEMDVFRKDTSRTNRSQSSLQANNSTVPNFKKFKKKPSEVRREIVPVYNEDSISDGPRYEDEMAVPRASKAKRAVPQNKTSKSKSPALFLDNSDDDEGYTNGPSNPSVVLDDDDDDDIPVPKPAASRARTARAPPKRAPARSRAANDDSDDEAVFKGFG